MLKSLSLIYSRFFCFLSKTSQCKSEDEIVGVNQIELDEVVQQEEQQEEQQEKEKEDEKEEPVEEEKEELDLYPKEIYYQDKEEEI
jgi:hypothetical protein